MARQLPWGKGGAGSTASRWEDVGAPWGFALQQSTCGHWLWVLFSFFFIFIG